MVSTIYPEDGVLNTRGSHGKTKILPIIIIMVLAIAALTHFKNDITASFNPIQIISNASTANIKETDGRTNILILGSDERSSGAEAGRVGLTDTLLVASIGKVDNDLVLISLPRDLWVQSPSGHYSKINEVYPLAESRLEGSGPSELSGAIEDVLGVPIHYYAVVSFELFTNVIDTLGGITVEIENSFTDSLYPIQGKENAPENERYEVVHFEKGTQTMDGQTALKYVRSRKGDNNEGTDFARSKRQQKVVMAIKDKAFSIQTLINPTKLKELYSAYESNIKTNVDLTTVQGFYTLSQQIDFNKVVSVVLDDRSAADSGGLLYAPEDRTLYNNLYVLLPQTGDYTQIHAYVQKYLFGNK